MDKEEFELLSKAYGPIVTKIINDNVRFYRFIEKIKWRFGYDENIAIIANCNRNTNIITINLKAFMDSYFAKDLLTIEYFLLHEIRHVFQHSCIKDYTENKEVSVGEDLIKTWIKESENYATACDENGNEREEYFSQDLEMDAYAFSYAVMKYKYDDVSMLYVPEVFGDDFYEIVESWLNTFSDENL